MEAMGCHQRPHTKGPKASEKMLIIWHFFLNGVSTSSTLKKSTSFSHKQAIQYQTKALIDKK